jgi:hypothetical protein
MTVAQILEHLDAVVAEARELGRMPVLREVASGQ